MTILNLLDCLPLGTCLLDNEFTITHWSRTLSDLTGISEQEILGSNFVEKFSVFQRGLNHDRIKSLKPGSPPLYLSTKLNETLLPIYDSAQRPLSHDMYICAIHESEMGSAKFVVSVIPREEIVQQSKISNPESTTVKTNLQDIQSRFISRVSHEFRTPLNSILGFCELSLRQNSHPSVNDYLGNIQNSAQSLHQKVEDLLILKDDLQESSLIQDRDINLHEFLGNIALRHSPRVHEKGLVFQFHCDPMLPAWINAPVEALEKVIDELLTNARNYTHSGEVQLEIQYKEDSLQVSVTDTGCGIAINNHSQVFDSFHQEDETPTRQVDGLGVGLSVAKKLCDLMSGSIDFDSQQGAGSTFRVKVPVVVRKELFDPLQSFGTVLTSTSKIQYLKSTQMLETLEFYGIYLHPAELMDSVSQIQPQVLGVLLDDANPEQLLELASKYTLKILRCEQGLESQGDHQLVLELAGTWLHCLEGAEIETKTDLVLLVESDMGQQIVTSQHLGNLGFEVHVAPSTKEALSLASQYQYAAYILESTLNGSDDFVREFRARVTRGEIQNSPLLSIADRESSKLNPHLNGSLSRNFQIEDFQSILKEFKDIECDGLSATHKKLLQSGMDYLNQVAQGRTNHFLDLVQSLLNGAEYRIEKLNSAIQESNEFEFKQHLHSLRGAFQSMNAAGLVQILDLMDHKLTLGFEREQLDSDLQLMTHRWELDKSYLQDKYF